MWLIYLWFFFLSWRVCWMWHLVVLFASIIRFMHTKRSASELFICMFNEKWQEKALQIILCRRGVNVERVKKEDLKEIISRVMTGWVTFMMAINYSRDVCKMEWDVGAQYFIDFVNLWYWNWAVYKAMIISTLEPVWLKPDRSWVQNKTLDFNSDTAKCSQPMHAVKIISHLFFSKIC